jgi:hypothetical protein
LETEKYGVFPKEYPANCPLQGRLSNDMGLYLSGLQVDLDTIRGNLTGNQYIREVLQTVVILHFDNHPLAARPVFLEDNSMHIIQGQ